MNSPAIETLSLSKRFGPKFAVEDLSLSVNRGEVFGFLGPNGAGKTTSVKMLLGLISPTSGQANILGQPLGDPTIRSKVGFLPEHFRFHDWLTAQEFLSYHGELYRMPPELLRERIPEMLELVGLTEFSGQKLREFSKGMLQRIGIAQALINEPDLVILDEPTSGLDPVGRRHVRDIIQALRRRGATVFLNSHLLSEVEITCDRVAFIKRGRVVQVSPLRGLVDGNLALELHAKPLTQEVITGLSQWGKDIRVDGDRVSLMLSGEADISAINRYLVERGVDVYGLHPERVSLEDLFIRIIGTEGGL